jgi:hypothetical protein
MNDSAFVYTLIYIIFAIIGYSITKFIVGTKLTKNNQRVEY